MPCAPCEQRKRITKLLYDLYAKGGKMLPAGVRITAVRDSPYITPGNTTGTQTTYTYYYNNLGPFTLTVSGNSATPEAVQAAIQAKINALTTLGVTGTS